MSHRLVRRLFQEFGKKQKFSWSTALGASAACPGPGVSEQESWWKFRHSSAPPPQTPPPVAATVETRPEPEAAPPVPEDEPSSGTDQTHSARTLVTGIYHVSSADSSYGDY